MGQKTNPNIFRLGKIKEWNSKYIEKKTTESPTIVFRDLEIRKFIYKIFSKNELHVQNCKIYYSENSLHIYVSYYNSAKPLLTNNSVGKKEKVKMQSKKIKSKLFQKRIANVRKSIIKKQLYLTKTYQKAINSHSKGSLFQNQYLLCKKTQRLEAIKSFKAYIDGKKHKNLNEQALNLFISKILKSLNLFVGKQQNIFLNLKQINNETTFLQKVSKTNKRKIGESVIKLRKFQQNEFFKKGFTMLYNFTLNNQDPKFLAEFIAFYLRKLKRPNFFLRFVKITLKTFLTKNFSKFERVQIKIKGRFNGAPRSTHKFINIGKNIPVLTLNSKINYGESTAYTSNGTFGIKVWTYTAT